jgi:DNA/RNA-binding domain of Phe-tRNA-synthetase-like protein
VVDLLNLVSISSGFSIGGYDSDKIEGDVVFGIGETNEPYQGIGRGELNIEGMPVFRDLKGAFGTPTSDSVRTSVSLETQRFLMIIIDYANSGDLGEATKHAINLLEKYANATNLENKLKKCNEDNL